MQSRIAALFDIGEGRLLGLLTLQIPLSLGVLWGPLEGWDCLRTSQHHPAAAPTPPIQASQQSMFMHKTCPSSSREAGGHLHAGSGWERGRESLGTELGWGAWGPFTGGRGRAGLSSTAQCVRVHTHVCPMVPMSRSAPWSRRQSPGHSLVQMGTLESPCQEPSTSPHEWTLAFSS